MFGRATIKLGIGPHSSFLCLAMSTFSCVANTVIMFLLWSPYVIGPTIIFSCCGLLWSPYGIGQTAIFSSCRLFFLSSFFFFFSSPNVSRRRSDVYHTSTYGVYASYHMCRHFGAIAQLCWAISSELRHVSTSGKKLVKEQYLFHMS